ncbi:unnamed protein product [Oppiella nova]|uniref:Uncharacterized protein n=1 Tax=Oppiella nova TaxID=334625 RepID=A0A7R9LX27_9ACAR|nr:unnamed protein product [Oppiella nova]CAG2167839.1 unnamed protein product [Oppiella nova]
MLWGRLELDFLCLLHRESRIGTTRERIFYSNYYVWTVVLFDYITTFILSIIVNVLVTKPFANLLNMIYKRDESRGDIFDDNNNKWQNGKEVTALEDINNNNGDVVVKNVAFDANEIRLAHKSCKYVTHLLLVIPVVCVHILHKLTKVGIHGKYDAITREPNDYNGCSKSY